MLKELCDFGGAVSLFLVGTWDAWTIGILAIHNRLTFVVPATVFAGPPLTREWDVFGILPALVRPSIVPGGGNV